MDIEPDLRRPDLSLVLSFSQAFLSAAPAPLSLAAAVPDEADLEDLDLISGLIP